MRLILEGDIQTLPDLMGAIDRKRLEAKEAHRCVFIANVLSPALTIEVEALPGLFPEKIIGPNPRVRIEAQREMGELVMPVVQVLLNDRPVKGARAVILFAESSTIQVLDGENRVIYTTPRLDAARAHTVK